MTWIDETRVALIGGNKGQTLIIDTTDFSMTMGPNTTLESVWHSCAKFSHQGKDLVIVIGGISRHGEVASTQIWDPTSDQGWEKGPDLPNPCSYSSAVVQETSEGEVVLVMGCNENPEKIYQLSDMPGGQLKWGTLSLELEHPRSNLVAMMIPDEFAHCN